MYSYILKVCWSWSQHHWAERTYADTGRTWKLLLTTAPLLKLLNHFATGFDTLQKSVIEAELMDLTPGVRMKPTRCQRGKLCASWSEPRWLPHSYWESWRENSGAWHRDTTACWQRVWRNRCSFFRSSRGNSSCVFYNLWSNLNRCQRADIKRLPVFFPAPAVFFFFTTVFFTFFSELKNNIILFLATKMRLFCPLSQELLCALL